MIPILLAFVLSGAPSVPAPARPKCIIRCVADASLDGVQTCYYDELPVCGKRQQQCVDSSTRDCVPRSVDLGTWDPVPENYSPERGY